MQLVESSKVIQPRWLRITTIIKRSISVLTTLYYINYNICMAPNPSSYQVRTTKSYIVYVYHSRYTYVYVYQTISICISKISFTLHGLYYHIVIKKNKKCPSMNLLLLKLFPPKLMLLDRVCEIRRFGLQYIYDRVIIDLLSFTQSNYIYYVCPM